MWIAKINNEFVKIETLDVLVNYIVKKMRSIKSLKEIIDFKDESLPATVEECLKSTETYKLETILHEFKLTMINTKLNIIVYIKIPSAKSKMRIQEHTLDIDVIDVDRLKSFGE
jgi:hypothetical protein